MPRRSKPPPPEPDPEWTFRLLRDGLINPDGTLTGDGELKLHQLKLREWMAANPPEKRKAKRKAAAERRRAKHDPQLGASDESE